MLSFPTNKSFPQANTSETNQKQTVHLVFGILNLVLGSNYPFHKKNSINILPITALIAPVQHTTMFRDSHTVPAVKAGIFKTLYLA